jgi:hypothetical protein
MDGPSREVKVRAGPRRERIPTGLLLHGVFTGTTDHSNETHAAAELEPRRVRVYTFLVLL